MLNAKIVVAATGLFAATAVNGHMVMKSPQPHNVITALVNGVSNPGRPLSSDGSDFPCRNTGSDWSGPTNSYALGSKQQLAFTGSAVHGGGSCQVSITYDTAPTKDSVFKVIHTIQGGCPARNTAGNLGDDASLADPFTYDYTVPSDIPAGNATIAWSWINRIGNREYYMECGVLELTGTGGDQSNFDKLPDLFVANIDGVDGGCTTDGLDGQDVPIPNPGDSVETNVDSTVTTATGYNAACKSLTAGSGSGATSAGTTYKTSAAVTTSSKATATATSVPGGVFITKTSQATTTAAPVTTAVPVSNSAPAATSTAIATATAGTGSGTSTSQKTGACSTEGTFACLSGGTSFQQCASGTWSTVMQMAAGTECTPGESTDMKIAAISGRKRTMRALRN